jgi:hypothetical protein
MSDFDAFIEEYGSPVEPERASAKELTKFKGIVPDPLVEFWERFGFGGYGQGLVWVVNPTHLEDVLAEWVPAKSKKGRAVPVARSAFGNVVYWQDEAFTFLNVHYDKTFQAGSDAEVLFDFYLVDRESRKSILEEPLHKKALKLLGMLQRDEMYTYKLPLALGGNSALKNMQKAMIREQLSILAQVHGRRQSG